jgi:hypothetical protein
LRLADCRVFFDCCHCSVRGVKPSSLNVGGTLRITSFSLGGVTREVLSSQAGHCSDLLFVQGSRIATGLLGVLGLKFLNSGSSRVLLRRSMEIVESGLHEPHVMILRMTAYN